MGELWRGKQPFLRPCSSTPSCSPGSTLISCVLAPSLPRHDLTPSHPWRPQKRDYCFLPHTRTWRPTRPLSPLGQPQFPAVQGWAALGTPMLLSPSPISPISSLPSSHIFCTFLPLRRICRRNPRGRALPGVFLPSLVTSALWRGEGQCGAEWDHGS